MSDTKRCIKCGETKPLDEFNEYRKRDRPGRVYTHSDCRTCHSAERSAWYFANKERQRETHRKWYQHRYATDPEFRAICIERSRQSRGTPPERYAVGVGTSPMVDVGPIRAAVEWSGLSWSEIGARCGIDESAVRRGLEQEKMNAAKAGKILEAIGSSPAEVGI